MLDRLARSPSLQRPNASRDATSHDVIWAFSASFNCPGCPLNSGRKSPAPAAVIGRRSGHFGTLVGATGGTQTHSRRTGRRLGQTRYARQGLVRVPESNTKYGGKVGITGVDAAPVMGPSISES